MTMQLLNVSMDSAALAEEENVGVALVNGLGGDAGFGENIFDRNDDLFTTELNITSVFENGINFYGREFESLWVNNNGSVTFDGGRSTFTPEVITQNESNPEITPFYADVDTRGGAVSETPGGNSTGSNLVYYDFDEANDRFIVTWDDVGYYSNHTDALNAFQLILTDRSDVGSPGDFDIEFRYEDINWTTGDASDGENGLGGTVARAGWTASTGNPEEFFELPVSGDQAGILSLDDMIGNTGDEGRWLFQVRSGDVAEAGLPALPEIGASGAISGDPHLVTLDGIGYDFHATGEYVLSQSTDPDNDFEIQARMTPVGEYASVNMAAATMTDGGRVVIDANDSNPVSVEGNVTEVENFGSLMLGQDQIFREDNVYTVVYAGDDGVVNDGDSRMVVTVHDDRVDIDVSLNAELAGSVEGLLGDGDGNGDNDIALADGTVLDRPLDFNQLYGDYRDDWRVMDDTQSLFDYDEGESLDGFYDPNFPEGLLSVEDFTEEEISAAEELALNAGLVEGTVNFENAVFDYLLTGDSSFIDSALSAPTVLASNAVEMDEETAAPPNSAPVATDDPASTNEGEAITLTAADLLGNDSDVDGDTLIITSVGNDASKGVAMLNGDGTVTYTPTGNENGSDSFTYTISDGNDGTASAMVNLTINPVNDDPEAADDEGTTDEGVPFAFDLLSNDSDIDGDTLSISSLSDPENGTVVTNEDGTVTYTPDDDFFGDDSFEYTIADGNGGTDSATATVTVFQENDEVPATDPAESGDDDDDDDDEGLAGMEILIALGLLVGLALFML